MKIVMNIKNGDLCHISMFNYISISKIMILIMVSFVLFYEMLKNSIIQIIK